MRNNQTLFFILAAVVLVLIGLWALNTSGPDVTSTTTTSTERSQPVSGAGEDGKVAPTTRPTERSATGTGTSEAGKGRLSAALLLLPIEPDRARSVPPRAKEEFAS